MIASVERPPISFPYLGDLSVVSEKDKYGGAYGVWEDANCPTGGSPDWRLECGQEH